jgi:AMP-binding enzyme C-terminal domain
VACALLGRFAPGERLKEMIIRGGENIYPREIEQAFYTHPGVADVAVVGVPDDHWGEQVAAFIRPAPGQTSTDEELAAYCRTQPAAHKIPRHWVFTDTFPLTASGKVQNYRLREQRNSGQAPVLPAGQAGHLPDRMRMPRVHRGGRRETWSDGRKIAELRCQGGRSGITRPMEAAHGYRHDD